MAIGFVAGRKQDLLGIRTFAWCFAWTYPPVATKHKYISSKNENSAIFSHLSDVCAWSDLRTRTDTSLETSTNLQYPVQSISENDLKTGGLGCSRTLEVKNSWSRRPNRCLWVMRVFHVSCHHLHGLHWPKLQPRSDFQSFQPNHILMCHQSAPSSWRPARSKSEKCFMFFSAKIKKPPRCQSALAHRKHLQAAVRLVRRLHGLERQKAVASEVHMMCYHCYHLLSEVAKDWAPDKNAHLPQLPHPHDQCQHQCQCHRESSVQQIWDGQWKIGSLAFQRLRCMRFAVCAFHSPPWVPWVQIEFLPKVHELHGDVATGRALKRWFLELPPLHHDLADCYWCWRETSWSCPFPFDRMSPNVQSGVHVFFAKPV